MRETLTEEQKERLLANIKMVMDEDVLTLEDSSKILHICLEACKEAKMEIDERLLMNSIERSARGGQAEE